MIVFCDECRFFDPQYTVIHDPGKCISPSNRKEENTPQNWKSRETEVYVFMRHPKEINELNNCSWFEVI